MRRSRLEPVDRRHADVHQHDVGSGPPGERHGGGAVVGLARRPRCRPRPSRSIAEAGPHERLVVGQDDADHRSPPHVAWTRKPPSGARPATSWPPVASARSRMPRSPTPAAARRSRTRAPSSATLDRELTVLTRDDPDLRLAGLRVADDVRERLLHDAVGGGADRRRDAVHRALGGHRHAQAIVLELGDQVSYLRQSRDGQRGRRAPSARAGSTASPPARRARRRWRAGCRQGLLGRLGAAVDHVRGGAGLHVDGGHGVRDAVVQVAGDAQPLLRDPPPQLLLVGALERPGALTEPGDLLVAAAHDVADEDRDTAPPHEEHGQQQPRAGGDAGDGEDRAQRAGADRRAPPVAVQAHAQKREQRRQQDRPRRQAMRDVHADHHGDDAEDDARPPAEQGQRHSRHGHHDEAERVHRPEVTVSVLLGAHDQEEQRPRRRDSNIASTRRTHASRLERGSRVRERHATYRRATSQDVGSRRWSSPSGSRPR